MNHPLIRRGLALLLAAVVTLAPRHSLAVTVLGIGAEAEEIVAAITAAQAAITTLQQRTNQALNMMRQATHPEVLTKAMELQQQVLSTTAQMQAGLQEIGFTVSNVKGQYDRLFLTDPNAWRQLSSGQLSELGDRWSNNTNSSIRTALGVLAQIADVRTKNAEAAAALNQSGLDGGEVAAQIQSTNRLLANISAQVSDLTQGLANSGRINAEAIATANAEKRRSEEISRRAMDGFNKRDTYTKTYSKLP